MLNAFELPFFRIALVAIVAAVLMITNRNPLYAAFRRGFTHIADRLVGEFSRRADEVYASQSQDRA